MKQATLYTDGASLGNPGPAGIGVYLEIDGKIFEISEHIGTATNNVAEYSALIRGLEEALRHKVNVLKVFLDSELLVRQITGQYRVKNEGLKPFHEKAMRLISSFRKFSIKHVSREHNAKADRLSKQGAKKKARPHTKETASPSATDDQHSLFD